MTLLGIKNSTKDIDFIIPQDQEYRYLIAMLQSIGYKRETEYGWRGKEDFIFDLYAGNKVYKNDLLESPLGIGNNTLFKEYEHIYIGVLNNYDIIITKLFRASSVDIEDCAGLVKATGKMLYWQKLESRFRETASYSPFEGKVLSNFSAFKDEMKRRKLL